MLWELAIHHCIVTNCINATVCSIKYFNCQKIGLVFVWLIGNICYVMADYRNGKERKAVMKLTLHYIVVISHLEAKREASDL